MVICYNLSSMIWSTFNPLATILNQNKLVESNYVHWKRNLDIVLTASGYKHVIPTDCPREPKDQKDIYTKWLKDDEMAKYYMQASMPSVLQHQHESFKTVANIFSNLKEMLTKACRLDRQPLELLWALKWLKEPQFRNKFWKWWTHWTSWRFWVLRLM